MILRNTAQKIAALPAACAVAFVSLYQYLISPLIHSLTGCGCRFEPTCSSYAKGAYKAHGFLSGSLLTFKRLLRCNPMFDGGHDPVPPHGHPREDSI